MNKSCVINFANGAWYQNGAKRLYDTILNYKNDTSSYDLVFFNDYSQIESPHHHVLNYVFKFKSLKKALDMGYKNVLWLDSSMYCIKPIDHVFDHIKNVGYAVTWSEFNNAQWTNDRTLEHFRLTRDEAEKTRHIYSGCFGINKNYKNFENFYSLYENSLSFLQGNWNNSNNSESTDSRCCGHRHDQSILSLILNKLNMNDEDGQFFEYWNPSEIYKEKTCFVCRGM